ncbi:MAG: NAD(P)H-dependent glycerol-3-phosphate dehydrogenase, partial [Thermodesulfobacteriota bacterium]
LCFKEMGEILNEFSDDKDLILKFCAFGDFNLTTNSDKSRNRTLGMMVGKGMLNLSEFNPSIIFEGLKSIKAIEEKSNKKKLNVPIIKFVNRSLNDVDNVKYMLNNLIKSF